jgi:methylenetetrahydrofolate reductase (NADPH)
VRDTADRTGGPPDMAAMLERPRFELVPLRGAEEEASHLPDGATTTVTCSPRRGVDETVALVERLAERGFRAVPHVAARTIRSPGHLEEVVGRLQAAGVEDVFVIGGDPPRQSGPYPGAGEILDDLGDMGSPFGQVGIAGYPERHPFIDREELFRSLAEKQPAATYVVTQICFDPSAIRAWVAEIRKRGVTLPVHVGLPGAVTRRRLLEIALRIGVGESARYLTKHGNLVARLMRRGSYRPDALLAGLAAPRVAPIAGLHINTFNQIRSTERWRRRALAAFRLPPRREEDGGFAS